VLVADVVWLVEDRGPGGRGVLDALVDVGHFQGEVDDPVTVQPQGDRIILKVLPSL